MIHGCDVSAFQLAPAHWTPEAGAISFAGVKATELGAEGSRYISPDLAADAAWLAAHGLGRIFYAYGHPRSLPSATVALLAEAVHPFLEDSDGIALDLEVNDSLSPAEVASWARITTAAMREVFERPCVIYSDLGFFEAGNAAGCEQSPLWIADISRPAGQPRIPAPWKTYLLHQFSWQPLDRDVANVANLAELRAAIGKAAPPKPRLAPEDPMLLNRGAGAVTPVSVPTGCTSLRLYCAGLADLEWSLVGEPVHSLALTPASSEVITLPAGKHAVKIVRKDAGGSDVSVVAQA